ncbi:PREDICTED: beta-glucosidase 3-like isoform X3 [Brassica oleracea var. oleracea]|uniref:beta-glucosidase 3-like isoform X3 n=1 Tax=Brassica oleracea var. oleracea TaxID=109376 RepID=UPI0006A6C141|nr:PREDICTED: beta-glucosidase 3-like isoform X3 [Brassica oleracea var. oleracea]
MMLGPLIFGDYPDEMKRTVGSRLPVFSLEESEQVKGSSDFIGIIHYLAASVTRINFKPSLSGHPDFYSDMGASMTCWNQKLISFKSQTNTLFLNLKYLCFFFVCALIISSWLYCWGGTDLGNFWAFEYVVAPWAMEVVLEYLKQSYGNPPVYILENGRPLKQDCSCNRRIHRGLTIYMFTLVLCLNPLGMDQTREATLYGHLWIYTSY